MSGRYCWCMVLLPLCQAIFDGNTAPSQDQKQPAAPQYRYAKEDIHIPAATADERTRVEFSLKHAIDYVETGAYAWTKSRACVTCHTNGTYMVTRPALTRQLGKPSDEIRTFFATNLDKLNQLKKTNEKQLRSGTRPAQVIYTAAGLAEWDAHVLGKLSSESVDALRLMIELQLDSGTWVSLDCWPPFESSAYQLANVAAMAIATAPGWLEDVEEENLQIGIERLKDYLRNTTPPHDYGRLLLLWTSTRLPGLVDDKQKQRLLEMIWKHQRDDGGWAIRTFATVDQWSFGRRTEQRTERLRSEPDFKNPASDGHQTGLAVLVLRDAGISAKDPRIQKAVKWLRANQRESGRWWTRSLNTDRYHFITYSGTCYPLLALARCDALMEN